VRVDVWEEVAAQGWSDVFVREVIQREGEDYFMEVQWQRAQVEGVCYRLYIFDKVLGALEGEGVVHSGGIVAQGEWLLLSLVRGAVSGAVSCGELELGSAGEQRTPSR
jgi:hypothetical protein